MHDVHAYAITVLKLMVPRRVRSSVLTFHVIMTRVRGWEELCCNDAVSFSIAGGRLGAVGNKRVKLLKCIHTTKLLETNELMCTHTTQLLETKELKCTHTTQLLETKELKCAHTTQLLETKEYTCTHTTSCWKQWVQLYSHNSAVGNNEYNCTHNAAVGNNEYNCTHTTQLLKTMSTTVLTQPSCWKPWVHLHSHNPPVENNEFDCTHTTQLLETMNSTVLTQPTCWKQWVHLHTTQMLETLSCEVTLCDWRYAFGYPWWELPQVSFLSRQTRVCRDKTLVATKMILVASPANDIC